MALKPPQLTELINGGLSLQWGRHPDGRFWIGIYAAVPSNPPSGLIAPVMVFRLTDGDEEKLKATLAGVMVATAMPPKGELARMH